MRLNEWMITPKKVIDDIIIWGVWKLRMIKWWCYKKTVENIVITLKLRMLNQLTTLSSGLSGCWEWSKRQYQSVDDVIIWGQVENGKMMMFQNTISISWWHYHNIKVENATKTISISWWHRDLGCLKVDDDAPKRQSQSLSSGVSGAKESALHSFRPDRPQDQSKQYQIILSILNQDQWKLARMFFPF